MVASARGIHKDTDASRMRFSSQEMQPALDLSLDHEEALFLRQEVLGGASSFSHAADMAGATDGSPPHGGAAAARASSSGTAIRGGMVLSAARIEPPNARPPIAPHAPQPSTSGRAGPTAVTPCKARIRNQQHASIAAYASPEPPPRLPAASPPAGGPWDTRNPLARHATRSRSAPLPRHLQQTLQPVRQLETALHTLLLDLGEDDGSVADPRAAQLAEQLCSQYNAVSMQLIDAGSFEAAAEMLAKAELLAMSEDGPLAKRPAARKQLQATTCNNLGCLHRHRGKPHAALQQLERAAEIEAEAGAGCASPATLLNLAACCSSLGRHVEAVAHAEQAVGAAAMRAQVEPAALEAAILLSSTPQLQLVTEVAPYLRYVEAGTINTLAMAYYNMAVECEHLEQWQRASEAYRMAVELASRFSGKGAPLTLTMHKSAEAFHLRLRRLQKEGKVVWVATVPGSSIHGRWVTAPAARSAAQSHNSSTGLLTGSTCRASSMRRADGAPRPMSAPARRGTVNPIGSSTLSPSSPRSQPQEHVQGAADFVIDERPATTILSMTLAAATATTRNKQGSHVRPVSAYTSPSPRPVSGRGSSAAAGATRSGVNAAAPLHSPKGAAFQAAWGLEVPQSPAQAWEASSHDASSPTSILTRTRLHSPRAGHPRIGAPAMLTMLSRKQDGFVV